MSNYSSQIRDRSTSLALLLAIALSPAVVGHAAPFQEVDAQAAQRAAEEAARKAEERRRAEEYAAEQARREQQRIESSMRDFLKDSREIIGAANEQRERQAEILRRAEFRQFSEAFRTFELARNEFAEVIGSKAVPKDPVKAIQKSTDVFLDFIKRRGKLLGNMDTKHFKDYTALELRREMLTTAERLTPKLETLLRSENANTVDVSLLMSMSKIEEQLLRLQWMTRKVR
jgi:flagellar biosynthesis GTPase FlhF